MGRKLARLFQEEKLIESWWNDRGYLNDYFVYRDYSRNLIKSIHKWLKDPGVQMGLTDMPTEKQWVIERTSGDTPSFKLYDNIARWHALRWFDRDTEGADARYDAFIFLAGWTRCVSRESVTCTPIVLTDS
jgi:hypothetical protein